MSTLSVNALVPASGDTITVSANMSTAGNNTIGGSNSIAGPLGVGGAPAPAYGVHVRTDRGASDGVGGLFQLLGSAETRIEFVRDSVANGQTARTFAIKGGNDYASVTSFSVGMTTSHDLHIMTGNTSRLVVKATGAFEPGADNTQSFGSATKRFSVFWAGTATISTSGRDTKRDISQIPPSLVAVARRIKPMMYRFLDAYAAKGEAARLHFGVIWEDVYDAFAAEAEALAADGLPTDPLAYAILCRDQDVRLVPHQCMVDKPRTVQRPETRERVEMCNGVPTLVRETVMVEEPAVNMCAVMDGATGKPVMSADNQPVLYPVPITDKVVEAVMVEEPAFEADGVTPIWRKGVRYEELLMLVSLA